MPRKIRDWLAVSAHFRKGGAMKHKNSPRGGAKNSSRDLIYQGSEESQEESPPQALSTEREESRRNES